MLYGGFDNSFIDINIKPVTNTKELIEELPAFGVHHTNTKIELIPGGNGFNVVRTLSGLGHDIGFVGPSSPLFELLVKKNCSQVKIYPIKDASVNYTAILNMHQGEIQFNSLKDTLKPEVLDKEIISKYAVSMLKPISNISLNAYSIEWFSALLLGVIFPSNSVIYDSKIDFKKKLDMINGYSYEGIIFIDPCDITGFTRLDDFLQFLLKISCLNGERFLSVNEFELKTLLSFTNCNIAEFYTLYKIPIIYHTSKEVLYYADKKITFPAQQLKRKVSFVGAGDCFNGGFISSYLLSFSIEESLQKGIDLASNLIETGMYPPYK